MSSQCLTLVLSFWIPASHRDVIPVLDTGILFHPMMVSSQCQAHNCTNVVVWEQFHQWGVIPVPRHWDPGNLIASNALGLVNIGFAL
ncbi:MAG: hypothetical protein ACR5LA_12805 [Wolbachia sp.]